MVHEFLSGNNIAHWVHYFNDAVFITARAMHYLSFLSRTL